MGQEGYRSFHPGWVRHKASNATIRVKYDDGYMIERVKGDKNEVRLYKDNELIYEKLKVAGVKILPGREVGIARVPEIAIGA